MSMGEFKDLHKEAHNGNAVQKLTAMVRSIQPARLSFLAARLQHAKDRPQEL
jgi:hypothetical protein